MKFMMSGDATAADGDKVMVYSQSGAGKTHWATRSPMPLFLLFEPQGKRTIRHVRDDASIIELSTWEEFNRVFDIIKLADRITLDNGQPAMSCQFGQHPCTWQTLVIDSLTHLQQAMLTSLLNISVAKRLDLSVDRNISQNQWGKLLDVMAVTMDAIRALPCNVIGTALAVEQYDDMKRRRVLPDILGQAKGKLPQYFNAVGYATVDVDGNRVIVWLSDNRFCVKPAPGWPRITPADVTLGSLALSSTGSGAIHEDTDNTDSVDAARRRYPDKVSEDTDTTATEDN